LALLERLEELRLFDPEPLLELELFDLEAELLLERELFDLDSATFTPFFHFAHARSGEPVKEVALHPLALLIADLPLVVIELELHELPLDAVLVVELAVGLFGQLLGDPDRPSHGRKWQQRNLPEKAHG